MLYRGFGANGKVWVHGRVQEDQGIAASDATHSRLDNLLAMVKRASTNPLPNAAVRVSVGPTSSTYTADAEGFFSGWMNIRETLPPDVHAGDDWIAIEGELLAPRRDAARARGRALYPTGRPEMLVISDIDDTVLQSRVTNLLRAAQTLAFGNARTRLPFPGVAAFYQALRGGSSGSARNPLVYVSSSPWNLYDVIVEFLDLQGIPAGPVLLRDLDITLGVLSAQRHHDHKGDSIRRVMHAFPDVPVILIGDSGQQDPEIYHGIVHEFRGRVRAVYIRNVTMDASRSAAIQMLATEVLAAGSSLVLADDTLAAATHAAEHGFIPVESLAFIGADTRADEGRTAEKADAPGARAPDDQPSPTVVVEEQ